jgi:hypothetical protein
MLVAAVMAVQTRRRKGGVLIVTSTAEHEPSDGDDR